MWQAYLRLSSVGSEPLFTLPTRPSINNLPYDVKNNIESPVLFEIGKSVKPIRRQSARQRRSFEFALARHAFPERGMEFFIALPGLCFRGHRRQNSIHNPETVTPYN